MFQNSRYSLGRRLHEGGASEKNSTITDDELYKEMRGLVSKAIREKFSLIELARWREPEMSKRIQSVLTALIDDYISRKENVNVGSPQRIRVIGRLMHSCLGYGPLEKFFSDPLIMEVVVARYDNVWLEREGKRIKLPSEECFESEEHCRSVLERMLEGTGRQIDLSNPRVDARLPDGSRMKAHIPPVAVDGTTFTVRRFRKDITIDKLIDYGTVSRELMEWLGKCVLGRLNMAVSGGTASGKTTFCNLLALYISKDEWIVTIEDPAELQFDHPCVRRMEARPANVEGKGEVSMFMLLVDALRMHPDRIILGEARGPEAFLAINAMNTGHDGSLLTLHANNVRDALTRLENMILMANTGLSHGAIKGQIRNALDLVVHISQDRERRRRLMEVAEVTGEGESDIKTLWKYNYKKGSWEKTGTLSKLARERLSRMGVDLA